MRTHRYALVLIAACGGPAPAPATPSDISSASPSSAAPVVTTSAAAPPAPSSSPIAIPGCAQTSIDLPAVLPPCDAPGVKDLRDVSGGALLVEVTPANARVKPGGSVDFTFTMTNSTKAPLRLVLGDPQIPTLQVLDGQDRPIEPPADPPPMVFDRRCAHVDCAQPPDMRPPRAVAPPPTLTLAPGGVARMHLTWRARQLGWAKSPAPMPCCTPDIRQPIDVGPLPPDNYRLAFYPPVSPNDSEQVLEHDEAQVEVAP